MKIKTPILRRMGPIPFWRGTGRVMDQLERLYQRAMSAAAARLENGSSAKK